MTRPPSCKGSTVKNMPTLSTTVTVRRFAIGDHGCWISHRRRWQPSRSSEQSHYVVKAGTHTYTDDRRPILSLKGDLSPGPAPRSHRQPRGRILRRMVAYPSPAGSAHQRPVRRQPAESLADKTPYHWAREDAGNPSRSQLRGQLSALSSRTPGGRLSRLRSQTLRLKSTFCSTITRVMSPRRRSDFRIRWTVLTWRVAGHR
jgi:hypothetical protein